MEFKHHGAVVGVTGSCHEWLFAPGASLLIDCGLFQGAETSPNRAGAETLAIDFPLESVRALVVTHVHIDHVGRIPYLLAAGFDGPIYLTEPSAILLPLVLEDAMKVGAIRDRALINRVLRQLRKQRVAVPYGKWQRVASDIGEPYIRFQPAGHILGSAFVECRNGPKTRDPIAVFSGDLGAPGSALLPAPKSPPRADVLVIESTYGDRDHVGRRARQKNFSDILVKAIQDSGTVIVPAFSIGRTQELLYDLEDILHRGKGNRLTNKLKWDDLAIIVDSPLAHRFTDVYRRLRPYWDQEAKQRIARGRHPLSFEQLITVEHHEDSLRFISHLSRTGRPAVVLAASGMCAGGRVVNYLKAMLGGAQHDVVFVGYQARGTPGRDIQTYGPRGGYIDLDGERIDIKARIHTLSGYSAHAGQSDLIRFVKNIRKPPQQIRVVHGDDDAKQTLASKLRALLPTCDVVIPDN